MKVAMVLDDRKSSPEYKTFYDAVRDFYQSHNYDILEAHIHHESSVAQVQDFNPDVVFLWNGYHESHQKVANPLRGGDWKVVFHEVGWLPQYSTMYMDNHGLCGDALKHEEWVPFDAEAYARQRADLIKKGLGAYSTSKQLGDLGRRGPTMEEPPPPGYILILGQLEQDTSIQWAGSIKTMQGLVDAVGSAFPTHQVLYRPHPVQPKRVALPHHVRWVDNTGLYETLRRAQAVIAINSTALLEALLLHVPAVALGRGVWPDDGSVVRITQPDKLQECVNGPANPNVVDRFLWHLLNVQVSTTNPVFNERNRRVMLA